MHARCARSHDCAPRPHSPPPERVDGISSLPIRAQMSGSGRSTRAFPFWSTWKLNCCEPVRSRPELPNAHSAGVDVVALCNAQGERYSELPQSGAPVPNRVHDVDIDNTLVAFSARLDQLLESLQLEYDGRADAIPGIFAHMPPMPGASRRTKPSPNRSIPTFSRQHRGRIRRRGSTRSSGCSVTDGSPAFKQPSPSHHKVFNLGDTASMIVKANGADRFEDELVPFGTDCFADWTAVTEYLLERT